MSLFAVSVQDAAFATVFGLTLTLGAGCYWLLRRLERVVRENGELKRRAEEAMKGLEGLARDGGALAPVPPQARDNEGAGPDFASSLDSARLQKRLRRDEPGGSATEKYRLLASLAGCGVDAKKMGEAFRILKVSPEEASQLMKLSRISRCRMEGEKA